MVKFKVKANPSGQYYLPKEVREELGEKLELVCNAKAAVIFPEGRSLKTVLESLEVIQKDLSHRQTLKEEKVVWKRRRLASTPYSCSPAIANTCTRRRQKPEPTTTMQTHQTNKPSYNATVHIMQSKSAHKDSDKEFDNHVVQIALLMLIPLIIVLIWIALTYDKLLTNPFLAILLVLGVLVILFGGTIRFGPIKIQKKR